MKAKKQKEVKKIPDDIQFRLDLRALIKKYPKINTSRIISEENKFEGYIEGEDEMNSYPF